MSRIAVLCILIALSIGLARPAAAGDVVEGDGYRFRLPDGFTPLDTDELADSEEAQQALETVNNMLRSFMEVDVKLFARPQGETPDAVIVVFAVHLEDEMADAMRAQMNLDQLEAQMRNAQGQLDTMGVPVELDRIQRIEVGAKQEALELEMTVEDPACGDLNAAHMLFAIDDDTICMMLLQGLTTNAVEDATSWRSMVSSFRLQPREDAWAILVRYGPIGLGGLVFLLAFVILRRSGGAPAPVRPYARASLPATDGGTPGFSRALDGLPTYGGAQAALLGTNGSAPGAARVDDVPSPGRIVAPKIPRAQPREEAFVGAGVPASSPPMTETAGGSLPPASPPGPAVRPPLRPPVIPRPEPAPADPVFDAPPPTTPLPESALDVLPAEMPTNVAQRKSAPPPTPPMPAPPAATEPTRFQRNSDYLD